LRRARSAAENIIPTTTGAARAIGKVIPSVKGKMDGIAVRVPTPVVSLVDLTCELKKEVTAEEVNEAMRKYSDKGNMKGIFFVEDNPLVSSDFIGNPFSSILDSEYTKADGKLIKVLAWYDNEWAYSLRMVELAKIIG
jgi:glyceraldehyde 3-phosphate dehydrogenase